MACDASLIAAWLTARSIARGLPAPVADRGGFRVDASLDKELRRWVFPDVCQGLIHLGREIWEPRQFLKLCAPSAELQRVLPSQWRLSPISYVMSAGEAQLEPAPLARGYRLQRLQQGSVSEVQIVTADGDLAARGYSAEAAGIVIYDRIETTFAHQRRGLGRAVMTALASTRKEAGSQVLVATEAGRALYTRLGWSVISPYATAVIPDEGRPG